MLVNRRNHCIYSSPLLIGIPLMPNDSVLIKEVSFSEREHRMHSQYLLQRICILFTLF